MDQLGWAYRLQIRLDRFGLFGSQYCTTDRLICYISLALPQYVSMSNKQHSYRQVGTVQYLQQHHTIRHRFSSWVASIKVQNVHTSLGTANQNTRQYCIPHSNNIPQVSIATLHIADHMSAPIHLSHSPHIFRQISTATKYRTLYRVDRRRVGQEDG